MLPALPSPRPCDPGQDRVNVQDSETTWSPSHLRSPPHVGLLGFAAEVFLHRTLSGMPLPVDYRIIWEFDDMRKPHIPPVVR